MPSAVGYKSSMIDLTMPLGSRAFASGLGELVREARVLTGWTQLELAARSRTSQAAISRLENGVADVLDVVVLARVLDALGMRAGLRVEGRHLEDRRRQADAVHARILGFLAAHLRRSGWLPALEVEIGDGGPRGWIDLLAYREADRALIVDETKTAIVDLGAIQRSLAFYEREARRAANRLGWSPTRVVVLLTVLDSEAAVGRLAENRALVATAFPSPVDRLATWIRDPAAPAPFGWTVAACAPATRSSAWLRPAVPGSRRKPPAYSDYADAARRLRAHR